MYNNELIEVEFKDPENFLKIAETLTRIGVPSFKDRVLYQSCHILSKRCKYYIVHFKEMFLLDERPDTVMTEEDVNRRNSIIQLLDEWGLCSPVNKEFFESELPKSRMLVLNYKEKDKWNLKAKYTMGNK